MPPLTEGEGILIADLDFIALTNAKRIRDTVGHYSRPDLFSMGRGTIGGAVSRRDETGVR